MSSGVRKAASTVAKRSPFQLKILSLYAEFVRQSKTTPGLLEKVREGFRSNAHLSVKHDSLEIDFKLRRARNQLEMLKTSRTTSIKTFKF